MPLTTVTRTSVRGLTRTIYGSSEKHSSAFTTSADSINYDSSSALPPTAHPAHPAHSARATPSEQQG
jgi:hypothetical protein